VVDDISTNRLVVGQLLRSLDVDYTEAEGGHAALGKLAEGGHDLVLLDMNMPGMNGEATFRAIRGSRAPWSTIPVVAITADSAGAQRDRYLALGLDGYVPKPIDRHILRLALIEATRAQAAA